MEVYTTPKVFLIGSWGSEGLVSAFTDALYRGLPWEEALGGQMQELVERRIVAFYRQGHWSVFEFMGAQCNLYVLRSATACCRSGRGLTSAPYSTRSLTTSGRRSLHALCNGARPKPSIAFGSAPLSSNTKQRPGQGLHLSLPKTNFLCNDGL
jgi:hypothetical protein